MQRSYLVAGAEGEDPPNRPCLVVVVEVVVVEVVVMEVVEVVVVDPHPLDMLTRNNVCLLSYSLVDLCSWKVHLRSI